MSRTRNPIRFGITVGTRSYADSLRLCQAAEAAGFTTASFTDRASEPALEGWTVATAIAATTKKLIVTHATLNVPYRNVALLAKAAATLDEIAGHGRLELTLGAGNQQPYYETYGYPKQDAAQLFVGLRDAVTIMRGLWANDTFTHEGKVHSVVDATIGKRPPGGRIPIWIGALGPQMMRYTGRVADGWMKNRGWPESIDQLRGLVRLLEEGAISAKRDPQSIRRVLNTMAVLGEEETKRVLAQQQPEGPAYITRPQVTGSAQQVLDTIGQYRDEGIDTFHFRFAEDMLLSQVRRFGEEVIPKVQ
ncbi:MAG: LLM class flavin-dependent oxidoreductase [SAR202 cluster bacterium]|nr:LLM class flavin-dependent oxidoreductase [SAR202 cluster bacterium]